jgi:hypothetical protein
MWREAKTNSRQNPLVFLLFLENQEDKVIQERAFCTDMSRLDTAPVRTERQLPTMLVESCAAFQQSIACSIMVLPGEAASGSAGTQPDKE